MRWFGLVSCKPSLSGFKIYWSRFLQKIKKAALFVLKSAADCAGLAPASLRWYYPGQVVRVVPALGLSARRTPSKSYRTSGSFPLSNSQSWDVVGLNSINKVQEDI
jgi:hypothetical protein